MGTIIFIGVIGVCILGAIAAISETPAGHAGCMGVYYIIMLAASVLFVGMLGGLLWIGCSLFG